MPKENITPKVYVSVNEKGWMNEQEMGNWTEECWARKHGAFFAQKSMLIMDSMRTHLKDTVKENARKWKRPLPLFQGG